MKVTCPYCRKMVEIESKYCNFCGKKIFKIYKKNSQKKTVAFVCFAIVAAAIAILVFLPETREPISDSRTLEEKINSTAEQNSTNELLPPSERMFLSCERQISGTRVEMFIEYEYSADCRRKGHLITVFPPDGVNADPSKVKSTYEWDPDGKHAVVLTSGVSLTGEAISGKILESYDDHGNLIRQESYDENDILNITRTWTYNEYDDLVSDEGWISSGTELCKKYEYTYENGRKVSAIVRKNGSVRGGITGTGTSSNIKYYYDEHGLLIREIDGEMGTTYYEYDVYGNLIKKTTESGFTEYTYITESEIAARNQNALATTQTDGDYYSESETSVPPDYPEYQVWYANVIADELNVRIGPNINAEVIGKLYYGDQVAIINATSDGWGEIGYGWISLKYVEEISKDEIEDGYYDVNSRVRLVGIVCEGGLFQRYLSLDRQIGFNSPTGDSISTSTIDFNETDSLRLMDKVGMIVVVEGDMFNYRGGDTLMFNNVRITDENGTSIEN